MRYILYGTVGLLVVFFVINLMGFNAFYYIGWSIEWATRFLLPWIALYWFVRFVKTKEG